MLDLMDKFYENTALYAYSTNKFSIQFLHLAK